MMRGDAENDDGLLSGLWYYAAPARDYPPGRMSRRIFFGEPIVLGRTKSGEAFALKDVCAHRAAPLSAGRIKGEEIECPYHGWRFRGDGACAAIPSLANTEEIDISKIRVRRYHLHEANGLLWIFCGEEAPSAPPDIGLPASFRPKVVVRQEAAGPYDEAVAGLVDPAHTPFVHRQWWWREGAGLMTKEKHFEPTPLGFVMPPHPPSSNGRIYKILGGAPLTSIEFRLPGVRLEKIRTGNKTIFDIAVATPIDEGKSEITHMIFWDIAAFDPLQPIVARMMRSFLAQDIAVLSAQNENLKRESHRPLYVGDADEQAKWYFRLKRAWARRAETGGFVNPIEPARLRYRT
ncbi:MAG: Rieske 2Fe-2S domain-containing protein [Amphiplicatus sp.]